MPCLPTAENAAASVLKFVGVPVILCAVVWEGAQVQPELWAVQIDKVGNGGCALWIIDDIDTTQSRGPQPNMALHKS